MRATTPLLLSPFLAFTSAQSTNTAACASAVQIFIARGTSEMSPTGKMGLTAMAVAAVVPNVNITAVMYPAMAFDYFESVAQGTQEVMEMMRDYTKKCPGGRIVLMGYSQGGQAIMDALCGTSSRGFKEQPGLGGALADNLVAAVVFGDPSHKANVSFDHGTSIRNGLFPRANEAGCAPYASKIRSYCDKGDVFCDTGTNRTTHSLYVEEYTEEAAAFVSQKAKENPGSGTGSAGTGSGSGGTSPSGTPSPSGSTPSPTPTTRNAAAKMSVGYLAYCIVGFAALLNGLHGLQV